MTVQTERSKVHQRVLKELDDLTMSDAFDARLFRDFVRETIGRIRGPFLAQHPPRQVLRHLETVFADAMVRPSGAIQTHVLRSPSSRGLQVVVHMDDQPFIIDTIRLFLRRGEADYWGGFNVIFHCDRDDSGNMTAVGEGCTITESLSWLEADGGRYADDVGAAQAHLHESMMLARATVEGFRPMTRQVERFVERCDALAERRPDQAARYSETAAFLKWLLRDNFVFMGALGPSGPLGIETIPSPYQGNAEGAWVEPHWPGTVYVRKAQMESPIHRNGRIDEVLIELDEEGHEEDRLFLRGLFTYRAVTQPSRNVPILRGVLRQVLEGQEALPSSFRYKGIANVFDSLPTEFLFTTPKDAIAQMVELVLDSEQQQEVGVTVLRSDDGSAFCLVSMPKNFYSDDLRREVEARILSQLTPTYVDHGLFVGRYETLLLHYYLTGLEGFDDAGVNELIEGVRQMATPWTSRLWQAIAKDQGEERADYLVDTYGHAFPEAWTRRTPVERAVCDIGKLDALSGEHEVVGDLFEDAEGQVILRIYQTRDVYLTELLPVLDHFGLTVRSSEVVHVTSRGGHLQFDSFVLEVLGADRERLLRHREVFLDALPAVFEKLVDDDPLNELVITAGLTWRDVDVIRAYSRYMRQLQVPVSLPRLQTILLSKPQLCRRLYDLFRARLDPAIEADRPAYLHTAAEACDELMRRIHTHDQDLVFGGLHNLVMSTVRTNAYRSDRIAHYVSFKFDAAQVRDMRGNRPMFEIYVHARDVEGVHLRFGRVARGGLRWSDRADFRTEVLGLVTTQQVKNVVIVPEGSKGGFYLRNPERGRDERRAQADRLYETFIRGMLDVTDNVVDGWIVHPPQVVCHDEDDPYLVVAADKGTAHLSDTANGISEAYGFWLGDAFASGGSQGYDHKAVGITARGAWVLCRRHFAEFGIDPYTQPFTAAGVGDMGGDVFGNGLLESKQTRLVAAFNHLHVFLDPEPDAEASWAERKRLFDLGGRAGGWDHYDTAVISEGGGVFDRGARTIPLSPQAQALLGLHLEEASPEDVIRAILRADVDLFWSGGIGTYVKAVGESHADVDDRANDRFRVNGAELRAKVVGEGANLSFTMAARVEASRAGVRMNTDFIDNSGGVDMSDHEVNLKILLGGPEGRGELSKADRNALLASMTEEVADLVLVNNDIQGRQISRDQIRSRQDIFPFGRAISFAERHFSVARGDIGLPEDDELRRRAEAGEGLTRPELAVLSAYVKRYVYAELIASGRARELEGYAGFLTNYFPKRIQEAYPRDIAEHQLADEIAMTLVTTRLVGDAGASFVPLAVESTGRSVFDIADAYLRAQRLARAYDVRSVLEELRTTVALSALYGAWVKVDAGCRDVTAYWLAPTNRVPNESEIEEMAVAVDKVYELQADDVAHLNADAIAEMVRVDIPEEVALLVVKANYLDIALMVWWHARKLGASFSDVVICQLAAGRASRLQSIIDDLQSRPATGEWEPIAVQILANRFARWLREVVLRLGALPAADSVDALEPVLAEGPLRDVRRQVDMMLPPDGMADLATLLVLEERLQGAIARMPAA